MWEACAKACGRKELSAFEQMKESRMAVTQGGRDGMSSEEDKMT